MVETFPVLGMDLPPGQLEIVDNIVNDYTNRIIISACTRYGKTRAVAIGTLLYIRENPECTVLLLAPTRDQTKILRNYIAEHIANNKRLQDLIDLPKGTTGERLRKEASRKRITFKGNRELQTHTAGGHLMGFGGDLIVIDQSEDISDEKYRGAISRMLGDSPDAKLVEIINPWKRNHVWDHWISDRFRQIKINHEQAVKENRLAGDFIKEQREELTDYEFTVLYRAEFPEEGEDSMFKYSWLSNATERSIGVEGEGIYGLDVASGGADYNVLIKTIQSENEVKVLNIWRWDEADTMKTVGKTTNIISKDKAAEIRVDSIGIGKGVADRLEERGYNVQKINVGKNPTKDKDRFLNLKAQGFMRLRVLFEQKDISLPQDSKGLVGELAEMGIKHTSSGKIKIKDPGKSPDRADSLMLACLSDLSGSAGMVEIDW